MASSGHGRHGMHAHENVTVADNFGSDNVTHRLLLATVNRAKQQVEKRISISKYVTLINVEVNRKSIYILSCYDFS